MRYLILTVQSLAFISGLITTGCKEETPFLSKEEAFHIADSLNEIRDPFYAVKNVVAIINNDIFYFNRLSRPPRRITNTPGEAKTNVKLSADRSQIAYINSNGNPVIIRADDGQVLKTLTQFNYIDQMDWAKDRLTLYMLIGGKIEFYGEPLPIIQPNGTFPWDEVASFSMNSVGDQGYFIHYYNTIGKVLKYHSTGQQLDKTFQGFGGESYNYIDFYDNNGNFLLGFNNSYYDGITKIVCVQEYKFWSAYEWDYEPMNTPKFNAEREILLYGVKKNQTYQLKGVYLGTKAYENHGLYDRLIKVLQDYTSSTPIYLDWVQ